MPGNNYRKKEIPNPNRFCDLQECRAPFVAKRVDQRFCCHNHGEKDWRLKHKRVFFHKTPAWKAALSKPTKDPRRDTPERWEAYARANPIYAAGVLQGETIQQFIGSMFQR